MEENLKGELLLLPGLRQGGYGIMEEVGDSGTQAQ